MTAESDIAAIADAGENTALDVRTALTSVLERADAGLVRIDTVTLAADGFIDFTSIPGGFEVLILEVIGRGVQAGTGIASPALRFGDSALDTGSNYGYNVEDREGGTRLVSNSFSDTEMRPVRGCLPSAGSAAHYFGAFKVWIPGYADTSKWRNARGEGGGPHQGSSEVRSTSGHGVWKNTADPITRIRVMAAEAEQLASGSRAVLYGRQ